MDAPPALPGIRVCVFDAYGTLFDFNSAVARHRDEIGPQADRLSEMWRTKQLSYTWLRSLMGAYAPFSQVTAEALDHCLAACGVDKPGLRGRLMDAYRALSPFPEVVATLRALKAAGMPTAILSNGDPAMLDAAVRSAGIAELLDAVLSVDSIKVFKTDPRCYRLPTDRFGVAPREVCFLSSNCWDAHAGAHFGYRALWVNRAGAPDDNLPGEIAGQLSTLAGLPALVA
ncbi:MAG: haloacid dehalogenase type II [Rhodospirillales bacterium]|nr:haloacid dehalogenase type II [Rhodospirillales bacterium]QQS12993.1 MAG: haloacid dehalogenase type II [Rhodospirillales bacterium]